MSKELTIPTSREIEALSDRDLFQFDAALDELDAIRPKVRERCDSKLRQWVEVEGKTQTEIAEIVGLSQQRISQLCAEAGIQPRDKRGRSFTSPSKSDPVDPAPDDYEPVDGVVVDEPSPRPGAGPADAALHAAYGQLCEGAYALRRELRRGQHFLQKPPDHTDDLEEIVESLKGELR